MVHVQGNIQSVQFSSVTLSCPTLCDPMNRSTPGLPVHHQLLEFTQTQVHRVSDAIQPSPPLSSPSPPAPNPSQHQSLFQLKAYMIFLLSWDFLLVQKSAMLPSYIFLTFTSPSSLHAFICLFTKHGLPTT